MLIGVLGLLGAIIFLFLLIMAIFKKKPKKPLVIGLAACLVLFCVGLAVTPDPEPAADASASVQTEVVKEPEEESVPEEVTVCGQKVIEYPVLNGPKTEQIGTRGSIVLLGELDDDTLTQICEDVDGLDYNWFTVDCGDGTGLHFPGCEAIGGAYGNLDEDGSVSDAIKIVWTADDGNGYTLVDPD